MMSRRGLWMMAAAGLIAGAGAMAAWTGQPAKEGAKEEPKKAEGHRSAPQARSEALEAIKKLAGTWEKPATDGKPGGTSTFKVTSGGSMVLETMMVGSDYEMTNTYHMDGKDLVVTHYCAMGNQPRMKAEDPQNAKSIVFTFKDGSNLDPKADSYMGGLTLTIVDNDHIKQEWTSYKAGKPDGEKMVIEMTRKK